MRFEFHISSTFEHHLLQGTLSGMVTSGSLNKYGFLCSRRSVSENCCTEEKEIIIFRSCHLGNFYIDSQRAQCHL
ncbi:unnamed protein product [Moneuplotes crassus]|uniref:Uncharacterized protein n=1 Tax=Euplotes crassus TaxID=5936 RepID=A0AAD1XS96_EUPCR|nr:unnamed protein product [Moneuplotes crassus]